jgi:hypothetical protein
MRRCRVGVRGRGEIQERLQAAAWGGRMLSLFPYYGRGLQVNTEAKDSTTPKDFAEK